MIKWVNFSDSSLSNVEPSAVDIVDVCPVYLGDAIALVEVDGPLIPHLRRGVVSPYADANNLSLLDQERRLNGEEHLEPAMHALGFVRQVDAVQNVPVESCLEEPPKSMNFRLVLSD